MAYAEEQAAKELAKFLSTSKSYSGKSPLEERVRKGISKIADEIADEVISAHPELRGVIRAQVARVIALAMQKDRYLSSIVVAAVAKTLGTHVADLDLGEETIDTNNDDNDEEEDLV